MAAAFQAAKLALIKSIKLVHPQPSAQLSLATDASNNTHQRCPPTVGARPLVATGLLLGQALPHSTFDRELLAVYEALLHFRSHLEGRQFHLFTDHRPRVQRCGAGVGSLALFCRSRSQKKTRLWLRLHT